MRALRLVVAGLLAAMPVVGHAGETVRLFAAGSLREPLTEVARLFEARDGSRVEARFGASGLLRDEIAAKAQADVFASANMEHPRSLAEAGRSDPAGRGEAIRRCFSPATACAPSCGPASMRRAPTWSSACSIHA